MEKQKKNVKEIRVAIYCRMATDNDGGRGLEMQKSQLCNYAQAQGDAAAEVSKGRKIRQV